MLPPMAARLHIRCRPARAARPRAAGTVSRQAPAPAPPWPADLGLCGDRQGLLDLMGRDGRLDPSIGHLATRIGVAPSTVTRALARLRACGFLDWARRLIRCAD